MTEHGDQRVPDLPEAAVSGRASFSLVWLVPIAALIVGGWLVYRAYSERGPEITITFESGEGITADETQIRYRDVEVGVVEEVQLNERLTGVVIKARMVRSARRYLREGTRFWVVRARVAAGEVSGLGTLFSGAYIGVDPVTEGPQLREFQGLEKPPVVRSEEDGSYFRLRTTSLGSLDIGSPVFFKEIDVGQMVDYRLEDDGEVLTEIFVRAPFDARVTSSTRFWNASGIELTVDTEGVRLETEALVSVLLGGIAFDTPVSLESLGQPPTDHIFRLYRSRAESLMPHYGIKEYYLVFFEQSVRGLEPGAPVEFRGFEVGRVADVRLEIDTEAPEVRIPVLIEIEPERFMDPASVRTYVGDARGMARLVERGLRAQLGIGSLITGGKVVELDFFPGAPAASITSDEGYATIPTVPAPMEEIAAGVASIVRRLDELPMEEIAEHLSASARGVSEIINSEEARAALAAFAQALEEIRAASETLDEELAPALSGTLAEAEQTLIRARRLMDQDSATAHELRALMMELADAARAVRGLADYLDRHPEALLRGKEEPR